jgi:hypothetical protein
MRPDGRFRTTHLGLAVAPNVTTVSLRGSILKGIVSESTAVAAALPIAVSGAMRMPRIHKDPPNGAQMAFSGTCITLDLTEHDGGMIPIGLPLAAPVGRERA